MSDGDIALLMAFIVGLVIGSAATFGHFYLRVLPDLKRYVDARLDTINRKLNRITRHDAGYEIVEREPLERVLDALVESAQRNLDAILRGEHHTP